MFMAPLLLGLVFSQDTLTWKAPPPDAKLSYSMRVDVVQHGEDHHATMTYVQSFGAADGDKARKASYAWNDISVDGEAINEDNSWAVQLTNEGAVLSAEKGEEFRRMLSPLTFIYPSQPVKLGDKWSVDVIPTDKSAKKLTYTFEVKQADTTAGKDSFKVDETMTEAGPDAMKTTGSWWIGKDGRPLKFTLRIVNWMVPMAGPDATDSTINGTAVAPKT